MSAHSHVRITLTLLLACARSFAGAQAPEEAGSSATPLSEWLRSEAGPRWDRIVTHPFTDQLARGTVDERVMSSYLVQDHRFLDAFSALLASAIAAAPTIEDRIPGAQFLAVILGKENTYFERSFEALGIDAERRAAEPDAEVTARFKGLMRDAAASGSLPIMLAVLVVAEWSYASWGERVLAEAGGAPRPGLPFWCTEWIELHSGEYFGSVVAWLRGLLDRAGERMNDVERRMVRNFFFNAVDCEIDFFEMAMEAAPATHHIKSEL